MSDVPKTPTGWSWRGVLAEAAVVEAVAVTVAAEAVAVEAVEAVAAEAAAPLVLKPRTKGGPDTMGGTGWW